MQVGKKALPWMRAGCVAVTATALYFLVRRVHPHELLTTLQTTRPAWFGAALVLYGLLFVPASWRWHLALRLADAVVHFGATVRISLIGHFFYVIFFGAAGGDTAKSALYARWYRLPMPSVLAAASLDRLLGLGGLILFGGSAVLIAALHGAFSRIHSISIQWPVRWIVIAAGVIALALLWLRRSKPNSAWKRFTDAFKGSGSRLISSPRTLVPGIICGFLVQLSLSSVLALSLQAVSPKPLPWLQLAWTFPLISIIGALPVTVAGLGVRDTAALVLLGFCGVPGKFAVSASLLMASISLIWAVITGLMLWIEAKRQTDRIEPKSLSVVIQPPGDEAAVARTTRSARAIPEVCEVIVAPDQPSRQTTAAPPQADVVLMLPAGATVSSNTGISVLNALRDSIVVGGAIKFNRSPAASALHGIKRLLLSGFGICVLSEGGIFVRRGALEQLGSSAPLAMDNGRFLWRLRKLGRLVHADGSRVSLSGANEVGAIVNSHTKNSRETPVAEVTPATPAGEARKQR